MQLEHIFVRLDLDRWTLTCQLTMEVICRNATLAEAEEALRRHRCGQHQGSPDVPCSHSPAQSPDCQRRSAGDTGVAPARADLGMHVVSPLCVR
jgi:hypothetical protein